MIYQLSADRIWFPAVEYADVDGLLAIGGDLSVERLLLAYRNGIFPWFSEDSPIVWYAPHERFVLHPEKLKVSASMRKVINSQKFSFSHDQAFSEVISNCANSPRAGQNGTWITSDMQSAYIKLFELGHAHSIEVRENGVLIGGLYGVRVNDVFCGESMFSKVSNASKAALIYLCQNFQFKLIDCQVYTGHLESMGAEMISMGKYRKYLKS